MTSVWIAPRPLLLASTSRTRRLLLEQAGLPVEVEAPGVDERAVETAARDDRLTSTELALHLAAEKALAVSRRHPDRLVLGADQVLECDTEVFHKPSNRQEAQGQLAALSGRTHALRSAGALARGGAVIDRLVADAWLTMRPLRGVAIERYLDLAGPTVLNSVGVYQLEGLGIHLFDRVEGDHSTVLGLPLIPLLAALRGLGALAF